MVTRAEDNPFPSVLFEETEAADLAANPASGQRRMIVDPSDHLLYLVDTAGTATAVAGSGLTDPMTSRGDIIIRNASNATARLAKGAAGTYLGSDGTDVAYAAVTDAQLSTSDITTNNASTSKHGFLKKLDNTATNYMDGTGAWSVPAGTGVYPPPAVTNDVQNYAASGTSVAVTAAASASGTTLIALVYSTGRGCNSITQTNVTWTNRYTGNGNSQYLEVWTGVVAGGNAGTTATFAFTGSNKAQCEVFELPGLSAFTSASLIGSATTSSGATLNTISATAGAAGDYIIYGQSSNSPTSSYMALNTGYTPLNAFAGAGRAAIFRAPTELILAGWSIQSSSVASFHAFVKIA